MSSRHNQTGAHVISQETGSMHCVQTRQSLSTEQESGHVLPPLIKAQFATDDLQQRENQLDAMECINHSPGQAPCPQGVSQHKTP